MTNRIDHTNCSHPRTAAGRRACRAAVANGTTLNMTPVQSAEMDRQVTTFSNAFTAAKELTITTDAGKIRVGSIIVASVRGGDTEQVTIVEIDEDIKNGRPGWAADSRWGYTDQVVRVVKF